MVGRPPLARGSNGRMASPFAEARFEGSGVALGVDVERHAKWIVQLLHEVNLC